MLGRTIRPSQNQTKAIWTCIGVDPKRLAGHWFSLRDNGIDVIGNRVVPLIEKRRLEVGRFALDIRRLTHESLSRTVGSLGNMAVKYCCDSIESKISSPLVMRTFGEVFGEDLSVEIDPFFAPAVGTTVDIQTAAIHLRNVLDMQPIDKNPQVEREPQLMAKVTIPSRLLTPDHNFPSFTEIREPQFLTQQ